MAGVNGQATFFISICWDRDYTPGMKTRACFLLICFAVLSLSTNKASSHSSEDGSVPLEVLNLRMSSEEHKALHEIGQAAEVPKALAIALKVFPELYIIIVGSDFDPLPSSRKRFTFTDRRVHEPMADLYRNDFERVALKEGGETLGRYIAADESPQFLTNHPLAGYPILILRNTSTKTEMLHLIMSHVIARASNRLAQSLDGSSYSRWIRSRMIALEKQELDDVARRLSALQILFEGYVRRLENLEIASFLVREQNMLQISEHELRMYASIASHLGRTVADFYMDTQTTIDRIQAQRDRVTIWDPHFDTASRQIEYIENQRRTVLDQTNKVLRVIGPLSATKIYHPTAGQCALF